MHRAIKLPGLLLYLILNKTSLDNNPHEQVYQADAQLLYLIIDLAHKLKRICYLCDFVLLIYTYMLYTIYINDLLYFAIGEVPMILILGFLQYRLVAPKGNFINKIVTEIAITTNLITVKTAAFSGPLWFKKESMDIRINKLDMKLTEVPEPYPGILQSSGPVLKLSYGPDDVYIITSYFNKRLAEELQER